MSSPSQEYRQFVRSKLIRLILIALPVLPLFVMAIAYGAVEIPGRELYRIMLGFDRESQYALIVHQSRLPQSLTAFFAGAGLAVSGMTMQCVLRNPLCSPFTLGVSGAAAFGAAFSVCFLGGIPEEGQTVLARSVLTTGALTSSLLAVALILGLERLRGMTAETIILVGVAMSAFYGAGIMFLQYMADDQQLSAIIYWTFGDTARGTWHRLMVIIPLVLLASCYFYINSRSYNALALGLEAAHGLGIPVRRLRIWTMLTASFLTAVLVSLLGIIGFVGLIVPHLARLAIGSDNRFAIPFAFIAGGILLLAADTASRLLFVPRVMPVSILTALLGGPAFLFMLLRRRGI